MQPPVAFGHYACFANLVSPTDVDGYGSVTVAHRWVDNQIWGLRDAMGYYGFFDYLPANALISCHGPRNAATFAHTNRDGAPQLFIRTFGVFCNDDDFVEWTRGRRSASLGSGYGVIAPNDPNGVTRSAGDLVRSHQYFYMIEGAGILAVRNYVTYHFDYMKQQMLADTGNPIPVLSKQPTHWPTVTATVNRFLFQDRFATMCRVALRSPITGESFEIPFTTFGTTLAGARQQRRHPADGGWARWDDVAGPPNDRTLDPQ